MKEKKKVAPNVELIEEKLEMAESILESLYQQVDDISNPTL